MHKRFSRLNDDGEYIMKQKLLERWISWLFSFVVVPVVQANFYVTESEYGKQDVYYYQKRIWDRLTNKAITCLKDQRYQYLDDSVVRNILSKRSFGFSKLRIRPKENGVRVLANLKVSCKMKVEKSSLENNSRGACKTMKMFPKRVKFNYFKSVNCALRDSHAVLKSLRLKEPEKLGASVFDYNDVYRKLCPFLVGLKNRTLINPETFIVVADVSKAFDSVVQDKLMSVMKDVLQEETYLLKQYHEVVCMKKSLWVHENIVLTDQENSTISPEVISSFLFRSLPSVLVNQESNRYVNMEELFFNLKELVKSNILQLDKKFYLQGLGIPQGSSMSSLLCSLYYGDLERNVIFPFLEKCLHSQSKGIATINSPSCNYMLLRFIDDFLFVSTSRKQAASFFSRLKRGFRDYNCFMNEDKFCVNFDIGHISGHPQKRVYMGEDGISFLRWSGLLINCRNLEIQADYTKYLNNHLSSTLTVCWHGKPGRHLKEKLCAFMRPKCHPIFFDSNINSPSVVRLNIYQAFLLCAMKFHCYVCNLSYICKLQPRFYSHIIERSLRYMFVLIERRMQSLHLGSDLHPVLELDEGEVTWLGLNAFIKILKRKQSRHRELLSMLRSKLLRHRIASNESSQLNYAVDDSHSSLFWKIKY